MSKTPNIFVRSLRELRSTRCLAVTALLIAINVTLDLLGLSIKLPPNLRIGFGFLCNASIGMLFGPVVGMMAGVCMVFIAREFIISGFRMIAASRGKVIAAGPLGKYKTAAEMVCLEVAVVEAVKQEIHEIRHYRLSALGL